MLPRFITLGFIACTALAAHAGAEHGAHAAPATRTVVVRMADTMRFEPAVVHVQRGEAVRFVARNEGRVTHELVVGTPAELREHAAPMKGGSPHSHHASRAVSVPPGKSGAFVTSFERTGALEMACLEPGHYEAGMRGRIEVTPAATPAHAR